MSHTEIRDSALKLEETAVSTLAEFDTLELTLQGLVLSGKRTFRAEGITRLLTDVEEQEKKDSRWHRSPAEGEAYWVHAYPNENRFLFLLIKLPSDPAQGWARACRLGEVHPAWVFVPYSTFREAVQALREEILGGSLDSTLESVGQGLVYARLKAIFQTRTSKIGAEPAEPRPQKPSAEDVPSKTVEPIDKVLVDKVLEEFDKVLEEFGPTDKSSPD